MNAQEIIRDIELIYDTYYVLPGVRTHMMLAASVGHFLCKQLAIPSERVVAALLLHDIGSVVKFRIDSPLSKEASKEEQEQLLIAQQKIKERFGSKEHGATANILVDLGVDKAVQELINKAQYSRAKEIVDESREIKICWYADYRVAPSGVVSVDKRAEDILQRYQSRAHFNKEQFHSHIALLKRIEQELFRNLQCSPEDINPKSIQEHLILPLQ
jgi:hypothetical protein